MLGFGAEHIALTDVRAFAFRAQFLSRKTMPVQIFGRAFGRNMSIWTIDMATVVSVSTRAE